MKVKSRAPLPPWVDVIESANKDYWMSPCIPWLPSAMTNKEDVFDGVALTALVQETRGGRKLVEMRLEKREFTLKRSGEAVAGELYQESTVAFGAFPLKKFLGAMEVPFGRKATSRIFTFYEDDMDVITTSVAGGLPYDEQLVVNVCRGYDKPKRFAAGHSYATMTFLFNEGAKSFEKWLERLKCPKC